MLEDYLSGSKVCVLTVDPEAKHQCYLLNENAGKVDEEGVWWSNNSCYLTSYADTKSESLRPYGYYNGHYDFWDEKSGGYVVGKEALEIAICPDEECGASLTQEELEMYDGLCNFCGSCLDCMSPFTDCNCYRPKDKARITEWVKSNKAEMGWTLDY